jgi:hypothetical protein
LSFRDRADALGEALLHGGWPCERHISCRPRAFACGALTISARATVGSQARSDRRTTRRALSAGHLPSASAVPSLRTIIARSRKASTYALISRA